MNHFKSTTELGICRNTFRPLLLTVFLTVFGVSSCVASTSSSQFLQPSVSVSTSGWELCRRGFIIFNHQTDEFERFRTMNFRRYLRYHVRRKGDKFRDVENYTLSERIDLMDSWIFFDLCFVGFSGLHDFPLSCGGIGFWNAHLTA